LDYYLNCVDPSLRNEIFNNFLSMFHKSYRNLQKVSSLNLMSHFIHILRNCATENTFGKTNSSLFFFFFSVLIGFFVFFFILEKIILLIEIFGTFDPLSTKRYISLLTDPDISPDHKVEEFFVSSLYLLFLFFFLFVCLFFLSFAVIGITIHFKYGNTSWAFYFF
jgi:hypothetical protein